MNKFNLIKIIEESYKSEMEMGVNVESEHSDIYDELENWLKTEFKEYKKMPWTKTEFFKKIAEDHLKELPDYYTRLKKMENE